MRRIKTDLNPQTFTSGSAKIMHPTNVAEKGDIPKYAFTEFLTLPYQDIKVSDVRYYAAMQADSKISKIIRVPHIAGIDPAGDVVTVSETPDVLYEIQKVSGNNSTTPQSWDMTLVVASKDKLKQFGGGKA